MPAGEVSVGAEEVAVPVGLIVVLHVLILAQVVVADTVVVVVSEEVRKWAINLEKISASRNGKWKDCNPSRRIFT
jgi:hypothetical protein